MQLGLSFLKLLHIVCNSYLVQVELYILQIMAQTMSISINHVCMCLNNQYYLNDLESKKIVLMRSLKEMYDKHMMFNSYQTSQECFHFQFAKSFFIKWLGEDISKLIFSSNTFHDDKPLCLMISYKAMIYINVLVLEY